MAYSTKYIVNETGYALQRGGRYIGGQFARMGLRVLTAVGAIAAGISGGSGAFYATGLIGVGTGVGLQAYLNNKDYEHSKSELASMYAKEAASILHKNESAITVQDIEKIATQNPTINEHMERQRVKRNIKTGIWIATAAIGFIAASALFVAVAPTAVAAAAGASLLPAKILAGMGALTAFSVSKPIVKSAADKIYKLSEPTTVDIIKSLEWKMTKGQKISRAQVMEVYISAHPQLEKMVEQKTDGKGFMQLNAVEQERMMLQFGGQIRLDEVTQAINDTPSRMNARELAFHVHAQRSGAYPDISYKEKLNNSLSTVKERANNVGKSVKNAGSRAVSTVSNFVSKSSSKPETEAEPETDEVSTKWRDMHKTRTANREISPQGQGY